MELDKPHPEPANWRAVYEKIEKMRSQIIAPVDTMGCHTPMLEEGEPRVCFIYFPKNGIYGTIGDEHLHWDRLNASQHWSPSCSAPKPRMRLLPQRSKTCAPSSVGILRWMPFWKQRKKILRKPSLRSGFGDERLGEFQCLCFYTMYHLIHPLGRYIKQSAVVLRDRFDSDVPKTVEDLCSLPGVGPKMAFLCLQTAWDV